MGVNHWPLAGVDYNLVIQPALLHPVSPQIGRNPLLRYLLLLLLNRHLLLLLLNYALLGRDLLLDDTLLNWNLLLLNNSLLNRYLLLWLLNNIALLGWNLLLGLLDDISLLHRVLLLNLSQLPAYVIRNGRARHEAKCQNNEATYYKLNKISFHLRTPPHGAGFYPAQPCFGAAVGLYPLSNHIYLNQGYDKPQLF